MRRQMTVLSVLAAGTVFAAGLSASSASATEGPQQLPGNPDCGDLGLPNEFKVEPLVGEFPPEDTYRDGELGTESKGNTAGFAVAIAYIDLDPLTFIFGSTIEVNAVLVKAGPGANLFEFDPPHAGGPPLQSPKDDSISHITFCWGDEDSAPTTTTSTTTTSSTVPVAPQPDSDVGVPLPAVPVTDRPDFTG